MKYTIVCIICFFATQLVYTYGGFIIISAISITLAWMPLKYRTGIVARIATCIQYFLTIFIGYFIFKLAYGAYPHSVVPLVLSTVHLIVPIYRNISRSETMVSQAKEAIAQFPDVPYLSENLYTGLALKKQAHWTIFLIAISYIAYFTATNDTSIR